jgi:hypothetical protein
LLVIAAMIAAISRASAGQPSKSRSVADPMDARVAALIEKTMNRDTEQQAFKDLESLGCAAVPSIIRSMDDRRKLPEP